MSSAISKTLSSVTEKLKEAGIFVSIFLDPDLEQIEAASGVGAQQVELCTAEYAEMTLSSRAAHGEGAQKAASEISRIAQAAARAKELGLIVAAGHGLTYRNIGALAAIPDISEFNIGHNIISRSVFVGLNQAVREMIESIRSGIRRTVSPSTLLLNRKLEVIRRLRQLPVVGIVRFDLRIIGAGL